jgi:hypothetical protein
MFVLDIRKTKGQTRTIKTKKQVRKKYRERETRGGLQGGWKKKSR